MNYSVLVIFSCPSDQARLRLDREHRYLQKIIDLKEAQEKVKILQATTLQDIIEAISHHRLRVIHFSGHGSRKSIIIEKSGKSENGEELDVNTLSEILQEHCPRLEALILSSCYSSDGVNSLIRSASRIIAVDGEAGDEAAIEFSKNFYENYLSGISIDKSIIRSQIYLQANNIADRFRVLVARRGLLEHEDHLLIQTVKNKLTEESLLIDINEVEPYFDRLEIDKTEFISKLSSKIKIHNWLVYQTSDMEHAILSFGRYHAVFSWEIGMDLIKCRKIIRLKKEISEKEATAWLGLALRYNQLFALPYRTYQNYSELEDTAPGSRINSHQIRPFKITVEKFFSEDTESSKMIKKIIPDEIKLFAPTIIYNFNMALEEFSEKNYSRTIVHLETTLSAIHSVLELLTEKLSE